MTHGCMWREMWEEGGGRKIFTSFFFVGTVTGKVDFRKTAACPRACRLVTVCARSAR